MKKAGYSVESSAGNLVEKMADWKAACLVYYLVECLAVLTVDSKEEKKVDQKVEMLVASSATRKAGYLVVETAVPKAGM